MGSRRPLGRSLSGDGRSISGNERSLSRLGRSLSSSENEEDVMVPPSRADGRNYLANVRPENRGTLCSVMAHLTEETQPTFEKTLKSKAVSETSNVKFTCVISGHPDPELTWYKDDMEMDRYCGLPKYEIFHHGRTHSLHIYNCTEEDAAIYQASAKNCKGIVSCSGVLEVGAMNEFRIHQRFFAKIKQKADSKKRELEESRRRGKENQPRPGSPERAQRKRRTPGGLDPGMPPLPRKGGPPAPVAGQVQRMKATEMANGLATEPTLLADVEMAKDVQKEDTHPDVWKDRDILVTGSTSSLTKEPLAKKKIKMTSGAATKNIHQQASQTTGSANGTDDGMSLSQYLAAESQQAQASQVPMQPKEVKQVDKERGQRGQTGQCPTQTSKASSKAPAKGQGARKDPAQTSGGSPLTAVFYSLRDIFFGSKKKHDDEVIQNSAAKMEESETPTGPVLLRPPLPHDGELVKEESTWMDSEETSSSNDTRAADLQVNQPAEQQAPNNFTVESVLHGPLYTSREESGGILRGNQTMSPQHELRVDEGRAATVASTFSSVTVPIPQPGQTCVVLDEPMQIKVSDAPGPGDMDTDVTATKTSSAEEWVQTQDTESHNVLCYGQSASSEWTKEPDVHCNVTELSVQHPTSQQKTDSDSMGDISTDVDVREDAERIFKTWGNIASCDDGKSEVEVEETIVIVVQEPQHSYHSQTPLSLKLKQPDDQEIKEICPNDAEVKAEAFELKEVPEVKRECYSYPNTGQVLHTSPEKETINVPKSIVSETKSVTEIPEPSVSDTNHPLSGKTQTSNISKLVNEMNQAVVALVVPDVTPKQQSIQNDIILSLTKKVTLEQTQQDRKEGTGNEPGEPSNSEQDMKTDNVPCVNASFKDLVQPSGNGLELSNMSPPILVTLTLPREDEKITDTKEPHSFHGEGMQSSLEAPDTTKALREPIVDHGTELDELQKGKSLPETIDSSPEASLSSPTTLRRLASHRTPDPGTPGVTAVPVIRVENIPSGAETQPSVQSCENSPNLRRKDSLSTIPAATPEELASGARRKIFTAKAKEDDPSSMMGIEAQWRKDPESPSRSPSQVRRASSLQTSGGQNTPPTERRSPLIGRKKATLEVPKHYEEVPKELETSKTEEKPAEKEKLNPFKAPQVIRKIRGEPFSDASGHLKLWCQFFNVLSDSTIKWYRDEVEITEVKRRAGDESQVALAIVQVTSRDCGVYSCSIKNEYGADSTDYLLSADILSQFFLREDVEVGEEVEMTPLVFAKGLADPGCWGAKLFGRIMSQESHVGEGCTHKASRVKAIYGLEPIFESGSTCILKVRNPIAYGTQEASSLTGRNMEITRQECKVQNMVREYCKIFNAETRTIENFGPALEVIPLYLMYRPANMIPYATVEMDLKALCVKYSLQDDSGKLVMRTASEAEQKCCTFQHWIHQWTSGNLLVTQLEGVDLRLTNVAVVTKSKGYQGLSDYASPQIFEQFPSQHQCNYYCGLLGLRTLRPVDHAAKSKASRSPLLARKVGGSSSPQQQRKGTQSPQAARKTANSPKVTKKTDSGENKTIKHKTTEMPKAV